MNLLFSILSNSYFHLTGSSDCEKTENNENNKARANPQVKSKETKPVKSKKISNTFEKSEQDVLVSTGEQITCSLLAGALIDLGLKSRSWLSWQLPILTEGSHTSSRIKKINIKEVLSFIKKGGIPVITGFQGVSIDRRVTTIGRGGSDASAIAIAKFFGADSCVIYTDVDGVYTTDPKVNSKAKQIDKISYEEMLEMASLGAKVMQPSSIQDAMLNNIKIDIRSTFSKKLGTKITDEINVTSKKAITGISYTKDIAKITVIGVKDKPGVASEMFKPLKEINLDMIVQSSSADKGETDITFTIKKEDIKRVINLLKKNKKISYKKIIHNERIFSTDDSIKKNVQMQSAKMGLYKDDASSEDLIFSDNDGQVLKGNYLFLANMYGVDEQVEIFNSKLILGGKAFGLMGTDELRRDLMVGLLWGTPLALFIGIAVAVGSVIVGLIYGVYAGFKGRKTDEALMRFNDVIYALPALPFLIILAVTISNSIFMMIGFLMIFSWVGVAKVSRSMALQIKTKQYVEASKIMGQKNSKIIFKHIIPQLLPYTFASIAISVPAAITTEAGLSFLGLGDPTFPTWGQILHDANTFGAAARGLWWWIVPPGIMIAITGLSFVFIGNALDSIINPKLKK